MNILYKFYFVLLTLNVLASASARSNTPIDTVKKDSTPPPAWKEHWFQHNLLLKRVYVDKHVAFYFDNGMDSTLTWPFKILSDSWAYVKKNYGSMGSKRLFVVLHKGTYGGGHPSGFYSGTHDYRNTIDCGLNNWDGKDPQQVMMPIHEMGHLVNDVSHGTFGSPSDAIWGDSKFMEIFNYDVLMHIGREKEAAVYKEQTLAQADNFPHAKTYWFRDWFFPIYEKYGKQALLNKYFQLLSANYPKDSSKRFTRDLNWGEFIHFWSGAAGVNLEETAMKAFKLGAEEKAELEQARNEFPKLKY
jgi:hypothetical protein